MKDCPNIPGVERGGSFFKGLRIEEVQEIWALRKRVEFSEKGADLYIISKDRVNFLPSMPVLGVSEENTAKQPIWKPRVDPVSGAVITSRWENKSQAVTIDPTKFVAFGGMRFTPGIDLADIPKTWKIKVLVPQEVSDGIEAAMRQQNEIAHDYTEGTGVEHSRVEEALRAVYFLSEKFVGNEVKGSGDIDVLSQRAESYLRIHGLMKPRDTVWKKVANYTRRAAAKDSMNRINPMISRVLARAAYLGAVERELVGVEVKDKARKVYDYLDGVRTVTRLQIVLARDILGRMCGFDGRVADIQVFRDSQPTATVKEGWEIGQVLKVVSETVLREVQPAPYLAPATIARFLLTGSAYHPSGAVTRLVEERLKVCNMENLLALPSADRSLRDRKTIPALEKIRYAFDVLKAVINDPETGDTKIF